MGDQIADRVFGMSRLLKSCQRRMAPYRFRRRELSPQFIELDEALPSSTRLHTPNDVVISAIDGPDCIRSASNNTAPTCSGLNEELISGCRAGTKTSVPNVSRHHLASSSVQRPPIDRSDPITKTGRGSWKPLLARQSGTPAADKKKQIIRFGWHQEH